MFVRNGRVGLGRLPYAGFSFWKKRKGLTDLPTNAAGQFYMPDYCYLAGPFINSIASCVPSAGQVQENICELPFSSLLSSCQPQTPAQQVAGNIGPAASPASVASLQTQYAATDQQQCAADPVGCQAYQTALAAPTCSALLGTDVCNAFGAGAPAPSGFSVPWWAWAVGGGIFLVAAFGGRR